MSDLPPAGPAAGMRRLERSRLAILQHIVQREQRGRPAPAAPGDESMGDEAAPRHAVQDLHGHDGSRRSRLQARLSGWWQGHPGRLALELGRPALVAHARRHPLRVLGLAAAAGAALTLARPWRLISVSGVLLALVKSPQVLGLAMTALTRAHNPVGDEQAPD